MEREDENPSKRARVETEESAPVEEKNDVIVEDAVSDADENADDANDEIGSDGEGEGDGDVEAEEKKEKSAEKKGETAPASEECCAVCMDSDPELLLPHHNCHGSCNPTAWKICENCDEHLRSRRCPICRGDYAPLVLYKVTGPELCKVTSGTLPPEEIRRLLAKSTTIKQLLKDINIAVYSPVDQNMVFFLPRSSEEQAEEGETQAPAIPPGTTMICVATISVPAEKVQDDMYNFTNATWEELINQSENGTGSESLMPGAAFKRLFESTQRERSMLLTPIKPEDIDHLVNEVLKG